MAETGNNSVPGEPADQSSVRRERRRGHQRSAESLVLRRERLSKCMWENNPNPGKMGPKGREGVRGTDTGELCMLPLAILGTS